MRDVLYRSSEEHSADCADFPFEQIPGRVFLDTNVVDCLVKWSECVFDQQEAPCNLDATLRSDITALMHTFLVGSRANWDIVVSEKTIEELSQTRDDNLRERLLNYGFGLVGYGTSSGFVEEDRRYARDLARRLVDSQFLESLPDINDRELLAHAIALRCDAFCTRDRRTIHSKRLGLRHLPLRIFTPAEWWQQIRPWAGLWA